VERENEERDLGRPHSGQVIGHLVFVFLVDPACLELEYRVLWYESATATSVDVIDREGRSPCVVTFFKRVLLVFLFQLLLKVAICLKSHEEIQTGESI
jgi:hypothetical protein